MKAKVLRLTRPVKGAEVREQAVTFMALVSGDKETRVVLAFTSDKALKTLNALNELHVADALVHVGIWK